MRNLLEMLEPHDLDGMIDSTIHIDEYKSKMGDDADISVFSFKVKNKSAAEDLVNFIEKGYEWVLDADVSSGEIEDGEFLVFVEIERNSELPHNITLLLDELTNITDIEQNMWTMRYSKVDEYIPVTIFNLIKTVPLTADMYNEITDTEIPVTDETDLEAPIDELAESLDQLRSIARINIATTAPINDYTDSLRIAAGIK